MAENTHNCKDHASEVAICVPYENLGWIPVVPPKSHGNSNEGQQKVN